MRKMLVALCFIAAPYAQAFEGSSGEKITCFAQLVHFETGTVEMRYHATCSGAQLMETRESAERDVMEECVLDRMRYAFEETHQCEFTSCEPFE